MSKKNEWTPLPQINTQPKKGSVTWNVTRDREAEIQKALELGLEIGGKRKRRR